jgi:hypothetical protein
MTRDVVCLRSFSVVSLTHLKFHAAGSHINRGVLEGVSEWTCLILLKVMVQRAPRQIL